MKNLLLAIIILISNSLSSQNLQDSIRVDLGKLNKGGCEEIIGSVSDGFFVLKNGVSNFNNKYIIEKYDNSLNLIKSTEINLEQKGYDKIELENILLFNNQIIIFSSSYNERHNKSSLYYECLNTNTLEYSKNKTILTDHYSDHFYYAYDFAFSEDSSKFLLKYNYPKDKKDDTTAIHLNVFDNNMNKLWSKKTYFLLTKYELADIHVVSNKGDVIVLKYSYTPFISAKRRAFKFYDFSIMSYKNNGKEKSEISLDMKDKDLSIIDITGNNKDEIIMSGIYMYKESDDLSGCFHVKVDYNTNKIIYKKNYEFENGFLDQSESVWHEKKSHLKKAKENNYKYYNFLNIDRIDKEDGGIYFIFEQSYLTVNNEHSYNDIYILNIDKNGNLIWSRKIHKHQVTHWDTYTSYCVELINGNLYFIFNDNEKEVFDSVIVYDLSVKGNETPTYVIKLDKDGNSTKKKLFTFKDTEVMVMPVMYQKLSNNDIIILGNNKLKERFAKITID